MKVNLLKKQTIENYAAQNARSRPSFQIWLTMLKMATWSTPEDIKKTYGASDLLGNGTNRVVFDIAGNNYRMICKYLFGDREVQLYVCWVGTHAEYTTLCRQSKQYTIRSY